MWKIGDPMESRYGCQDCVVGQRVEDEFSVPPRPDKARPAQVLKMLRRVRNREAAGFGQGLDAPLPLRHQLQ